jgi:hypothetical protein
MKPSKTTILNHVQFVIDAEMSNYRLEMYSPIYGQLFPLESQRLPFVTLQTITSRLELIEHLMHVLSYQTIADRYFDRTAIEETIKTHLKANYASEVEALFDDAFQPYYAFGIAN